MMKLKMTDLITSQDGSVSLTKLAACTGHALFAAAFVKFQLLGGATYSESLWLTYAGIAIGHAVIDKGAAQVSAFKSKQLDIAEANSAPPPNTKVEQVKTETAEGDTKTVRKVTRTRPPTQPTNP